MKKRDFVQFLVTNNLSIEVVSAGDGWSTLRVFHQKRLIADMNEFKGNLDLDWAYEYIMDLSISNEFLSLEEIKGGKIA